MRWLIASLALCAAVPAHAQTWQVTEVVEWVEEAPAARLVEAHPAALAGEAFGPFRVLDGSRAALVDVTDAATPRAFAAMLRAHPGIAVLEMVECPGTDNDTANLALGRMIRARGIATHVPAGGSVRSGAVELFLAGARRQIDEGAEFAVHSWRDSNGRGPGDFAADSPVNRAYLDYYREMGVARPAAFYAMTNTAPFGGALWLSAGEMRGWAAGEPQRVARLDLASALP